MTTVAALIYGLLSVIYNRYDVLVLLCVHIYCILLLYNEQ